MVISDQHGIHPGGGGGEGGSLAPSEVLQSGSPKPNVPKRHPHGVCDESFGGKLITPETGFRSGVVASSPQTQCSPRLTISRWLPETAAFTPTLDVRRSTASPAQQPCRPALGLQRGFRQCFLHSSSPPPPPMKGKKQLGEGVADRLSGTGPVPGPAVNLVRLTRGKDFMMLGPTLCLAWSQQARHRPTPRFVPPSWAWLPCEHLGWSLGLGKGQHCPLRG